MKFVHCSVIAAFALFVSVFSLPNPGDRSSSSALQVDVKLERLSNTNFKISVTNIGPEPLRLVKIDGVLSDLDVNKISAVKEGRLLLVQTLIQDANDSL
jgi:hypothetical protein